MTKSAREIAEGLSHNICTGIDRAWRIRVRDLIEKSFQSYGDELVREAREKALTEAADLADYQMDCQEGSGQMEGHLACETVRNKILILKERKR